MKNYSQSTEQSKILEFFEDSFTGTFLDFGSNDSITLSNTHALALLGWYGVCVDGSKTATDKAKELYKNRPDIRIINAVVGDRPGKAIFYESDSHLNAGDTSLLSTTHPQEMKRWKGNTFTPHEVEMVDWATLKESLPYETYNMISIDIEGSDYSLLSQIDLCELGTSLVCVEWNGNDFDLFHNLFSKQGFRFYHQTPENLIYINDNN